MAKVLHNDVEIREAILAVGYGETHHVASPELVGVGESLAQQLRPGMGNKFVVEACVEVEPTKFVRPIPSGRGVIALVRSNPHPERQVGVTGRKFTVHTGGRA
ncbi:MAG: hypothetical protein IPG59_11885 [Candidatus Melainabacteria bacterium]|nr:MAG: hypothetical protein IPG59_11885 [Candidatus Melainabacteria bacterium]